MKLYEFLQNLKNNTDNIWIGNESNEILKNIKKSLEQTNEI